MLVGYVNVIVTPVQHTFLFSFKNARISNDLHIQFPFLFQFTLMEITLQYNDQWWIRGQFTGKHNWGEVQPSGCNVSDLYARGSEFESRWGTVKFSDGVCKIFIMYDSWSFVELVLCVLCCTRRLYGLSSIKIKNVIIIFKPSVDIIPIKN